MGTFGVQEMMVIFILALLLFGPKKLPELARMLGKGLSEFRRAKNELKNTFDTHMRELEREARMDELKNNPTATPPATTYNPYSYAADESGKLPSEYNYNGSESSYPSEPPVETHVTTPAAVVPDTIARGSSTPGTADTPNTDDTKEEHPG